MAAADGGVTVVTGAARGMGWACARRLASDGHALLLVDLDETLEEVAGEMAAAGGGGQEGAVNAMAAVRAAHLDVDPDGNVIDLFAPLT